MGEVYVRVRLSNAGDVERVCQGLSTMDQVRSCEVDALVDTGSARSAIPQETEERLGLTLIDNVFGLIRFEIMGRRTSEEAYVMGNEVLIGQTVLEAADLLVDCKNQKVNPKHPEGPIFRF